MRAMFKRPFQWREFVQQAWFIVSVTVAPTIMVAIPFGAILSLQVGNLIRQLGAQSRPARPRCWRSSARPARS